MNDFSGRWFTTFGRMDLVQSGTHVKGTYNHYRDEAIQSDIEGEVDGDALKFRYREPYATGTGWFKLKRRGSFSGRWIEDARGVGGFWQGHREFDGVWDTSFGLLRLIQEADRIVGLYEVPGGGTLEGTHPASAFAAETLEDGCQTVVDAEHPSGSAGTRLGDRFVFHFEQGETRGEGWIQLDEQQMNFDGKSRHAGSRSWKPCAGQRILSQPELQWLVVLEAHWERLLQQKGFSLGSMLQEFFARVPQVEVRHRFFASEADLETWCREVLYLAEPVALVIATHGSPEGIAGHNETIPPEALVKGLGYADNVTVLHFSACCIGDASTGGPLYSLGQQLPFPISGYAGYADWAASALVDFTYLDMILEHGLTPEEAAGQVKRLLPFAGDRTSRQCPYPATRFRFWPAAGDDAGRRR